MLGGDFMTDVHLVQRWPNPAAAKKKPVEDLSELDSIKLEEII